jgi:hypothetical protein
MLIHLASQDSAFLSTRNLIDYSLLITKIRKGVKKEGGAIATLIRDSRLGTFVVKRTSQTPDVSRFTKAF